MAATGLVSSLGNRRLLLAACVDSLRKLGPRTQLRNPVMFVVYVGSLLTTAIGIHALLDGGSGERPGFIGPRVTSRRVPSRSLSVDQIATEWTARRS